ncbi:MAG TPA: TAT-variant-translocated molybdopterin oxidoreductase [Thermoanaerobaculia bacterium]|nr:TAT-variant-translocated molybdopterin oxidoreductase [Thermoanaerobaculia bacterium]
MDSVNAKGKCEAAGVRPPEPARLDLAEVRERLRAKRGPEFWRSLDELAATPAFQDLLHREFPRHASEWTDGVSRRRFLQLASASLALAGLTGCTKQPVEKIIPYVRQPEQLIPGRPLYFATALTLGGYATGVLAESHQGRPTKIEGNPDHPASLGATDVFTQAAVLTLYDPERSQTILRAGRQGGTWGGFVGEAGATLRALQAINGRGLRLLTGAVTSPTLAAQIADLLRRFPEARWHRWEPAGRHQSAAAAARAFGRPLETRYDFTRARVIVTLGADVLCEGPEGVRYSRDFADGRRVRGDRQEMSRVYAVESVPSHSATVADHRLQLTPPQVEAFTLALAQRLGAAPSGGPVVSDATAVRWLEAVAQDLEQNRGASLVIAGEYASPAAQVLVHAVNQALGNVGSTVYHLEPLEADPVDHVASLRELVRDLNAGQVELLLMLDGVNPVYTAPADFGFAQALQAAQKNTVLVHHGLFDDETSEYCHWHIPAAHELESWSDARAFDGTVSLIQPLIDPLYGGKTSHEVLAALSNQPDVTSYDVVRQFWSTRLTAGGAFEAAWREALLKGLIPGTAASPTPAALAGGAVEQAAGEILAALGRVEQGQITLLFRPDPAIWDGRFASNAWLQELPKPIVKLTWDNALILSPKTAERLNVSFHETVEVSAGGRKVDAAVWILPGVAEDTALLTLGYGRKRAGKGTGQGFNAYALRTSNALWSLPAVQVRGTGGRYELACTQNHHLIRGDEVNEDALATEAAAERHVIRTGTLAELRHDRDFIQKEREKPAADDSMYPNYKYPGHAWGMAIDLNVCTGCSACVVACQSENNIPVVGKQQVLAGREMHWLRIDRYFAGDLDAPQIHHQPLPCMHCETAPCEVVCPVAATAHSDEGLNDMVYNRCVGTRYCSNNCPYKVRRFNFLRYSDKDTPVLALVNNPDVTVRMRGVMEKCTYCVQRIEQAKIESKVEHKPIAANQVQTACQQVCPTRAIVFGDINDPQWDVTRWKADPLNYGLLEEINTRPRTTYLAKLRNPNPLLEPAEGAEHGHA